MNGDIIRVDHEELERIANAFAQQLQNVEQILQDLQRAYEPLKDGGWIGLGSDAFCDEMDMLVFPSVRRLINALGKGSITLNEINGEMQAADSEASSSFRMDAGSGTGGMSGGGMSAGSMSGSGMSGGGMSGGGGVGSGGGGYGMDGGGLGSSGGSYQSPSDWLSGSGGSYGSGSYGSSGYGSSSYGGGGLGGYGDYDAGGYGAGGYSSAGNSGADGGNAARPPAQFRYQSLAGGGGLGNTGGGRGLAYGVLEAMWPGGAGGNSGMPIMLAAASPFVALLGKAIKQKLDEK